MSACAASTLLYRPRTWRTVLARLATACCVGDLGVVGVELHQHLAGFDAHAVVGADGDHRADRSAG
jgi:hypothetical protein